MTVTPLACALLLLPCPQTQKPDPTPAAQEPAASDPAESAAQRTPSLQLGLLEATVVDGPEVAVLRRVVATVANILSPLLASIELSEDLASEVAMRTRETEAQRRFTSKIIDSLPLGLYVIDRSYRIQAWNRK